MIAHHEFLKFSLIEEKLGFHEFITILGNKVNIQDSPIIIDETKLNDRIFMFIVEFIYPFNGILPLIGKLDIGSFSIDGLETEVKIHGVG